MIHTFFADGTPLKKEFLGSSFNLYVNLACLSVCLYPINVKRAESMRPKFFVGPHVAPGKVYSQSDFRYVILKYYILNYLI